MAEAGFATQCDGALHTRPAPAAVATGVAAIGAPLVAGVEPLAAAAVGAAGAGGLALASDFAASLLGSFGTRYDSTAALRQAETATIKPSAKKEARATVMEGALLA